MGAGGSEEHWLWLDTECMTHTVPFYSVTLRGWSSVIIPILLIGPVEAQGDSAQPVRAGVGIGTCRGFPHSLSVCVRFCCRPHLAAERQWWRFSLVGLSILNHVWNVALGQLQVRDVTFWRHSAGSTRG